MAILLGEEIELRRQLEQMEWLETFLKIQQVTLSPTEFLYAWNRHMKIRGDLHSFENLQMHVDVKPDLMVRNLGIVLASITDSKLISTR
jgi:hypothetical protein